MAKRVALTTKQAQEGAAADLVALLQTVTSDGRVTPAEIKALHHWLKANADPSFPGFALLQETIERICADGKVTEAERKELLVTIERVLPPDLRAMAKERRQLESVAKRERAEIMKSIAQEAQDAADAGLRPSFALDFLVAGVAYERRHLVTELMTEGETVYVIRDRANQHSENAVEVRTTEGFHIGFVPERDAVMLAPYLDRGYRHIATVKCLWRGRTIPTPVIVADFYPPDTEQQDAVREDQVPPQQPFLRQTWLTPVRLLVAAFVGFLVLSILVLTLASL